MRRVLREEKKFLLSYQEFYKTKGFLENVMTKDIHNNSEGYMVRSLYFDTIDDLCFNEKLSGLEKRKKIRIRVYDSDSELAYLEIKQKEGVYQEKRSLEISREDAIELIKSNYEVLCKYDNEFAMECYSILVEGNYKPKCVVEYKRLAYVSNSNNIRITFDSDIRASESNFNIFDKNLLLYPVLVKNDVIFEVKYNGFLLEYIKNFINFVDKSELSVSKYCLARQVSLNYNY